MLELSGVSASYGSVPAITDVSIAIGEGEAVGLLGANGAGKSTTLRAVSGLVKLFAGKVTFDGVDLATLPPYRIPELGIAHVPEGRQVFPEMTVQENLEIGAYTPKAKADRARTMELVYSIFPRLADRRKQLAGTMSGGEQQMVAIARAMVTQPACVLADEPTGNLDRATAESVFDLMLSTAEKQGTAFVVVTHDPQLAARCSRVLRLDKGVLQS